MEAEMDLTLAKSQGYLKNHLQQKVSSSGQLLAVIGVYTGFGSHLNRNMFRGSWMPKGQLGFLMETYADLQCVQGLNSDELLIGLSTYTQRMQVML